jgi:hypothetical protein
MNLVTKHDGNTCVARQTHKCIGARKFPTVVTTSLVQDLYEKIVAVDGMMR